MPDPERQQKSVSAARARLKAELKAWEKAFEKAHARRPSRSDIASGRGMALKYAQYAELRKGVMPASLLEPKDPAPSPPPVGHSQNSVDKKAPKRQRSRRRGHGFTPCALGTFSLPQTSTTSNAEIVSTAASTKTQTPPAERSTVAPTPGGEDLASQPRRGGHKGSWNSRTTLSSRRSGRSRPLSVKLGVGEGLAFVAAGAKQRSRLANLSVNRKAEHTHQHSQLPQQQQQQQQRQQKQRQQKQRQQQQKLQQPGVTPAVNPFRFGASVPAGQRWEAAAGPAVATAQVATVGSCDGWAVPAPSPNVFSLDLKRKQEEEEVGEAVAKPVQGGSGGGAAVTVVDSDSGGRNSGGEDAGRIKRARKGKHVVSRNFVRTDMRRKRYRSKKRRGSARDDRGRLKAARGFRTEAQRRKEQAEEANDRLYSDLMTPEELASAVKEGAQEGRHRGYNDHNMIIPGSDDDDDGNDGDRNGINNNDDDDDTSDEDVRQLRAWEAERERRAELQRLKQEEEKRARQRQERERAEQEARAKQRRAEEALADIPAWCLGAEHDIQVAGDSAVKLPTPASSQQQQQQPPPPAPVPCDAHAVLRNVFGFSSFRPGQEEAVTRVLRGESILLLLRTGGGKSLCYQLPAAVFPGLTLVVTPLISLMRDQLARLPAALPGGYWNSQQTRAEVVEVMQGIRQGKIKVLFVSPEKLLSPGFQRFMRALPPPGVSFACVDEAHCVSEWSHNFRPAYLRLSRVLRETLRVRCILALTATATAETERTVCRSLGIEHPKQVVRCPPTRRNLRLSVSREHDRDTALLGLLQSPRYKGLNSIIVYVMRQRQADSVAAMLRGKGLKATSYHAGKSKQTRNNIQERFMAGRLRLVVATIAFGMGLDKADVRAVIHYSMPRTLEHYVQEVGRAGRDGLPAFCHAFHVPEDCERMQDLCLQDCVDRDSIRELVKRVFLADPHVSDRELKAGATKKSNRNKRNSGEMEGESRRQARLFVPQGSLVPLDLQDLEVDLDLDEAMAGTLLSQLELGTHEGRRLVQIVAKLHNTATIGFHRTDPLKLARQLGVAAEILRQNGIKCASDMAMRGVGKGGGRNGQFSLDVCAAAATLNVHVADVQRDLIKLKANKEVSITWRNRCFALRVEDCVSSVEELEAVVDSLDDKMQRQEQCQLRKIDTVNRAFQLVSQDSFQEAALSDDDDDNSDDGDMRQQQQQQQEKEEDDDEEARHADGVDRNDAAADDDDGSDYVLEIVGQQSEAEPSEPQQHDSAARMGSLTQHDAKPDSSMQDDNGGEKTAEGGCVDLHRIIARYFRVKDEAELLDELEAADREGARGKRARDDRRAIIGRKKRGSKATGGGRGKWGRGGRWQSRQRSGNGRQRFANRKALSGSRSSSKAGASQRGVARNQRDYEQGEKARGYEETASAEESESSSGIDMTVDGDEDENGTQQAGERHPDQDQEPGAKKEDALAAFPWLRGDVMSFLARFGAKMRSGRDVARLLRGDHTPKFPRSKWKTCGSWGKYKQVPLSTLRPFCEECFGVFRAAKAKKSGKI